MRGPSHQNSSVHESAVDEQPIMSKIGAIPSDLHLLLVLLKTHILLVLPHVEPVQASTTELSSKVLQ